MAEYYYTFPSVTAAMQAARLLERGGIRTAPVRTPARLSRNGCGYAIVVPQKLFEAVQALLPRQSYRKLYRYEAKEWRELYP